jgi:hypothetical protein
MYRMMVFLHMASVLVFMLAHGAGAKAMFVIRRERKPERVRAVVELSRSYVGVMYGSLLLILITGIWAGILGKLWGQGWIWTSLVLLIAIAFVMSYFGTQYYEQVLGALGLETYETRKKGIAPKAAAPAELEALLRQAKPELLAAIGMGGLLVILWLMMFKPF